MADSIFQGIAHIRALDPLGMITVRCDLQQESCASAITKAIGADIPQPMGLSRAEDVTVLWMSPDELLVLCPYVKADDVTDALTKSLDGQHMLVADVSDARALFEVAGDTSREVVAKLTPADTSKTALTADNVRRTRLGQVAAAIWLSETDTIQIMCFRSAEDYVFDLLKTAAQQGSGVNLSA